MDLRSVEQESLRLKLQPLQVYESHECLLLTVGQEKKIPTVNRREVEDSMGRR
jgi:hypothetical protein